MKLSSLEQEIVSLKAITGSLDSMINRQRFSVVGASPDANILFETSTDQALFNVLLVDFLENVDAKLAGIAKASSLDVLGAISNDPQLGDVQAVAALSEATSALDEWLQTEVTVKTWLPSIEEEVDLQLTRRDFIWASGNISKHNLGRLSGVSKWLARVLKTSGVELDWQEALTVIDDFYDRFHNDILNYHASYLAELLNNVRWGIHEYLLPEFRRSLTPDPSHATRYSYDVPEGITTPIATTCYWDLMNEVRGEPYVPRFVVTGYLKLRY